MLLLNQMANDTLYATDNHVNLKLNDGVIKALYAAIAKGNYPTVACQLVGIHISTLYNWLNQAETDIDKGVDSIFSKLFYAIKRAEAEAEAKLVAVVRDSAEVERNWIAGMTFLERRHPDRWGRKDRTGPATNININIDKALIDASGKMEEALTRLAERTQTYELDAPGELLQRGDNSTDTSGD